MATEPVAYSRDAVLTLEQLAAALQVSKRAVQSMDLPYFRVGSRQRWVYGQVLDTLAERARGLKAA